MGNRERRAAIQEHLSEHRERVDAVVKDEFGVPAGYEPATLMSDGLMAVMCLTCGANVARRMTDTHDAWHQRLFERIGQN